MSLLEDGSSLDPSLRGKFSENGTDEAPQDVPEYDYGEFDWKDILGKKKAIELTGLAVVGILHGREAVCDVIEKVGEEYDYTASLPLRFLAEQNEFGKWEVNKDEIVLPILFWGDRFNVNTRSASESQYLIETVAGTIKNRFTRIEKGEEHPTYLDYLLFPPKKVTDEMHRYMLDNHSLVLAVHSANEATEIRDNYPWHQPLLEVHTGVRDKNGRLMNLEEIINWSICKGVGLAFDTRHIRDFSSEYLSTVGISTDGEPTQHFTQTGRWEKCVQELMYHTDLVHFQPRLDIPNEMDKTLYVGNTELHDMIGEFKRNGYDGPVVVEYVLPLEDQILGRNDRIVQKAKEISAYLDRNLYGENSTSKLEKP